MAKEALNNELLFPISHERGCSYRELFTITPGDTADADADSLLLSAEQAPGSSGEGQSGYELMALSINSLRSKTCRLLGQQRTKGGP